MTHHEITRDETQERARRNPHHLPVKIPSHDLVGESASILDAITRKLNERVEQYVNAGLQAAGQLDPSQPYVTPHTRAAAQTAAEVAVRLALKIDVISSEPQPHPEAGEQ